MVLCKKLRFNLDSIYVQTVNYVNDATNHLLLQWKFIEDMTHTEHNH